VNNRPSRGPFPWSPFPLVVFPFKQGLLNANPAFLSLFLPFQPVSLQPHRCVTCARIPHWRFPLLSWEITIPQASFLAGVKSVLSWDSACLFLHIRRTFSPSSDRRATVTSVRFTRFANAFSSSSSLLSVEGAYSFHAPYLRGQQSGRCQPAPSLFAPFCASFKFPFFIHSVHRRRRPSIPR